MVLRGIVFIAIVSTHFLLHAGAGEYELQWNPGISFGGLYKASPSIKITTLDSSVRCSEKVQFLSDFIPDMADYIAELNGLLRALQVEQPIMAYALKNPDKGSLDELLPVFVCCNVLTMYTLYYSSRDELQRQTKAFKTLKNIFENINHSHRKKFDVDKAFTAVRDRIVQKNKQYYSQVGFFQRFKTKSSRALQRAASISTLGLMVAGGALYEGYQALRNKVRRWYRSIIEDRTKQAAR